MSSGFYDIKLYLNIYRYVYMLYLTRFNCAWIFGGKNQVHVLGFLTNFFSCTRLSQKFCNILVTWGTIQQLWMLLLDYEVWSSPDTFECYSLDLPLRHGSWYICIYLFSTKLLLQIYFKTLLVLNHSLRLIYHKTNKQTNKQTSSMAWKFIDEVLAIQAKFFYLVTLLLTTAPSSFVQEMFLVPFTALLPSLN